MTTYFYTYNAVFDAPVSGSAKLAYAYLCKCADRSGKCYPSHKAIAAAAGVGVTTVKKALAELAHAGLIAIRGDARPDRGRRANIYTIIKETVKGFFVTYGNIFMEKLTAKARLVYLYFCRLASGRDTAFPAHKTTAAACGLSVSGARLAIDELEAAGLVERQAQYRGNGGQKSNLYTLTEPQTGDGEPDPAPKTPVGGNDNDATARTAESVTADTLAPVAAQTEIAETVSPVYSSSNGTSFSSGKSKSCETVISRPCAILCSVRSPGIFVCPLMMLSSVDCFMPESVASLFTVMPRSSHRLKRRFVIASEYFIVLTSAILITLVRLRQLYWDALSELTRARLTLKIWRYILTRKWVSVGYRHYIAAGTGGIKHPAVSQGGYGT